MIAMEPDRLFKARVSRRFSAPPQRVFDAWLDAKTAGQWLFVAAGGRAARVEIDPRAGGWFFLDERRNGESIEHIGEFLEMVRPHRIVFSLFAEKYSLAFERVTVVVNPLGSGCEVTLTHESIPELANQPSRDWGKMLDALAAMLGENGRAPALREVAAPK